MEGNSNSQVPDLASVLATLARLAPARSQQAQQQPIAVPQHHLGQPYRPPASQGYGFSEESPAMIAPRPIHSVDDGYDPAAIPQHRSPPSLIDPATITEWSQGLRCVSKIASDNPNFKVAIRKLIADQEKHVHMWWQARLAIIDKYIGKGSGGSSSTVSALAKKADFEAELKAYDLKVYTATREMADSMCLQLKHLGVPFFGTGPNFITTSETSEDVQVQTNTKPISGKITAEELLKLQRRMLQYLEDMYKHW